jgi:Icc-related predicted phosphoesterase
MGLFGRKKNGAGGDGGRIRIFFCTDVHGSTVCFKKFINAAAFYGADVLILGGDVTGKMVVPIARQSDGSYLTSFAGEDLRFTGADEVRGFVKRTTNMGFYPKVMEEEEFRAIRASQEAQDELFRELIRVRLEEWVDYADGKLRGTGVRAFAAPGNDDVFEVDDLLAESERIELLEMRVHRLCDEHEIVTSGWSNHTPWNTPREATEEELAERLGSMLDQVHDMERCIFNLHVPPFNSKIDVCPKLDDDLRVVYSMGNPVMAPAGSTAVREAVERHQPLLGLHGHIHEGRGEARIGRTLCVNPGSVYSEGILNGVLITLRGGAVHDHQFTQG